MKKNLVNFRSPASSNPKIVWYFHRVPTLIWTKINIKPTEDSASDIRLRWKISKSSKMAPRRLRKKNWSDFLEVRCKREREEEAPKLANASILQDMTQNPNFIIWKEPQPTLPSYLSAPPQLSRTFLTNESWTTTFDKRNESFPTFFHSYIFCDIWKTYRYRIFTHCKICLMLNWLYKTSTSVNHRP